MNENLGGIVIYTNDDEKDEIQVTLHDDTVWLTQLQIVDLFQSSKANISEHVANIYNTGELVKEATVRNFRTVRIEGQRKVTRNQEYYNLDMILSVGYRVNSKRGTQFRIWANRILKEHLIKGYTLNEKRLREKTEEIELLKRSLSIVERSLKTQVESLEQARNLVSFLSDFSSGLGILDDYDHEKLDKGGNTIKAAVRVTVSECFDVFAMLLYFVVKNHSFVDGNKRIAASLFLYFLSRNKQLYREDGTPVLSNEGLAAITLLIAESKSEEMETIKRVVVTMLNRGMV